MASGLFYLGPRVGSCRGPRGLPTGSSFSQGKSDLKRPESRGRRETPVASPSIVSEVVGGGQSAEMRAEGHTSWVSASPGETGLWVS